MKDNGGNDFANTLNEMMRGDQWTAVLRIAGATSRNKDVTARRAILLALYRIMHIKPGNAIDRIASGTVKKISNASWPTKKTNSAVHRLI